MATTITLEGAARTEFGKGAARRMRVANLIPATVYAGGEEPVTPTLCSPSSSVTRPRWPSSRTFSATR